VEDWKRRVIIEPTGERRGKVNTEEDVNDGADGRSRFQQLRAERKPEKLVMRLRVVRGLKIGEAYRVEDSGVEGKTFSTFS